MIAWDKDSVKMGGGKLEPGESSHEGAERELLGETGPHVEALELRVTDCVRY